MYLGSQYNLNLVTAASFHTRYHSSFSNHPKFRSRITSTIDSFIKYPQIEKVKYPVHGRREMIGFTTQILKRSLYQTRPRFDVRGKNFSWRFPIKCREGRVHTCRGRIRSRFISKHKVNFVIMLGESFILLLRRESLCRGHFIMFWGNNLILEKLPSQKRQM